MLVVVGGIASQLWNGQFWPTPHYEHVRLAKILSQDGSLAISIRGTAGSVCQHVCLALL